MEDDPHDVISVRHESESAAHGQIPVAALICSKLHEPIIKEACDRGANTHLIKPPAWENLRFALLALGGDRPETTAGHSRWPTNDD